MEYYPRWICAPCGTKYGKRPAGISTWHTDTCGICGAATVVTEPRDYGHLKKGWQKMAEDDGLCVETKMICDTCKHLAADIDRTAL